MRLSDENTREGRHLTPEERIALQAEEIKQLWQENEQLRAQATRMREALRRGVELIDGYYGMSEPHQWSHNKAEPALMSEAGRGYHNPADVEILKKIKWHIENYTQTGILDELDCAIAEIDKQIGGKDND